MVDYIELEILRASYWEHVKKGKDLSFLYPVNHPVRQELQQVEHELQQRIFAITQSEEYIKDNKS